MHKSWTLKCCVLIRCIVSNISILMHFLHLIFYLIFLAQVCLVPLSLSDQIYANTIESVTLHRGKALGTIDACNFLTGLSRIAHPCTVFPARGGA